MNREPQTFHRNSRDQDLPADKFHLLRGEWRESVVIQLLGDLQFELNTLHVRWQFTLRGREEITIWSWERVDMLVDW